MKAVTYRDSVPGIATSASATKDWQKLDLTKLFEGEFRMFPTGLYSSRAVADSAGVEKSSRKNEGAEPKSKIA